MLIIIQQVDVAQMHWLELKIIPIAKADKMSSPANYRPISILPIVSKVLECHNYFKHHHGPLGGSGPHLSKLVGFMPGCSTSALLSITNSCLQALDMGHDVCTILFFDICKRNWEELDDYLLHWLYNYQQEAGCCCGCTMENHLRNFLCYSRVSLKGQFLGHTLLFLVYINEVTSQVSDGSNTVLFTNDIALYQVITPPDD